MNSIRRRGTGFEFADNERRPLRARRSMAWGLGLAAVAIVSWLTIGGSTAVSAHGTTHPAVKSTSLVASGKGDKRLRPITVGKKWTVAWNFNCPGATTPQPFSLTAAHHGAKTAVVTAQKGLGGGGNKPYVKAGTYRLDVKTACNWKVMVKDAT